MLTFLLIQYGKVHKKKTPEFVKKTDWDFEGRRDTFVKENEVAGQLANAGEVEEALIHYEKAIKAYPNSVRGVLDRASAYPIIYGFFTQYALLH